MKSVKKLVIIRYSAKVKAKEANAILVHESTGGVTDQTVAEDNVEFKEANNILVHESSVGVTEKTRAEDDVEFEETTNILL